MCQTIIPLLILFGICVADIDNDLSKRQNNTFDFPIVATPSQHWEGNDGTWSTFEIRVGSNQQAVRVLPATSWQEVWVVWNTVSACNASAGVKQNCGDSRGGLFNSSESNSWDQETQNSLGVNEDLGYSGVAQYGFDTVGLGYTNTTGITLYHQIVAEIISESFWLGMLGLGFQPTNFSDYGDPQPSFSATLYSNGSISSKSWSYTAGAYYRLKSVFGSLIFGGYDASRFTPNYLVFDMADDVLRDVVLTIRSITSTNSTGNTTLMSTPEFAFIDSTLAELWLPLTVCQAFESAFGLELDNVTDRYLIDSSTHNALLSSNPNITLTLANEKSGGPTIDIVLPYAAFDLNISAPIINTSSFYFPIRRGADDTQYALGRTFLQEAYVTADYDSRTFNVSQCIFSEDAASDVKPIISSTPTVTASTPSLTPAPSHKSIGGGAIAGIVVGIIAFLMLLAALLLFFVRRSRRHHPPAYTNKYSGDAVEIDAGKRIEPAPNSVQASAYTGEVHGTDAKVEILGNPIMHPQELEAEVPMRQTDRLIGGRVNGDSGRSGRTNVSSLSPAEEAAMGVAELHGEGRKDFNGPDGYGQDGVEELVSPVSTRGSVLDRGRFERVDDSPHSMRSNAPWRTPTSRSRFEEHWGDAGL